MITFTGYIEVDGKLKYKSVCGSYRIFIEPNGLESWSGAFEILSGETPELIEGMLYMEDGKYGRILIKHIGLPPGIIQFKGSGPLDKF